jgi:Glucodextranase, domain B
VVVALGAVVVFAGVGVLGNVVGAVTKAFDQTILSVTTTPSPSPTLRVAPNAPTLSVPAESYTNQKTVDLTGVIPTGFIGREGAAIRVYRTLPDHGPQQIAEQDVGATAGFTVPGLELAKGRNDFSATLVDPGGESPTSKVITYILDTTKPKVTISKPAKDAVVNGKTVTLVGKTQARSALVAKNLANNASITGTAGDDGSFSLILAIAPGPNAIRITATDPANNEGSLVVNVNRGAGKLRADITSSRYQFTRSSMPADLTLTVDVTDPDGHPLDGATVQITLSLPGHEVISRTLTTDGTGRVRWRMTVSYAASGRGGAAALVQTKDFGETTSQTFITISK